MSYVTRCGVFASPPTLALRWHCLNLPFPRPATACPSLCLGLHLKTKFPRSPSFPPILRRSPRGTWFQVKSNLRPSLLHELAAIHELSPAPLASPRPPPPSSPLAPDQPPLAQPRPSPPHLRRLGLILVHLGRLRRGINDHILGDGLRDALGGGLRGKRGEQGRGESGQEEGRWGRPRTSGAGASTASVATVGETVAADMM